MRTIKQTIRNDLLEIGKLVSNEPGSLKTPKNTFTPVGRLIKEPISNISTSTIKQGSDSLKRTNSNTGSAGVNISLTSNGDLP